MNWSASTILLAADSVREAASSAVVSVRTPCAWLGSWLWFWFQFAAAAATETRETHRRVADGDAVPVGSLHVDVVVADGHVAEGRASGALERREEHVPPVLGELSNHAVAAIADERQDVIHGEDGLLLGAYLPTGKANRITAEQWRMDGQEQNLEAAVVVGEQADPSRARHGLGAHHAVLAAGVPHLNGDGLRHGCPCFRKGGKQTERGFFKQD